MSEVTVTLDEVYRLMLEVRDDVNTLKVADTGKRVDDHEDRIRSLERLVWKASGAAAVLGTLGGWGIGSILP